MAVRGTEGGTLSPEVSEMGNYHCEVQKEKVQTGLHGKGRSEETSKSSYP